MFSGAAVHKPGAAQGVFAYPSYVQHVMGLVVCACGHSLMLILLFHSAEIYSHWVLAPLDGYVHLVTPVTFQ